MKRRNSESFLFIQILVCILVTGISIYLYIDHQNDLTQLKIALPSLAKEVKTLHEENERLQYQIDQFENPLHLIELSRQPEFGHLKYPSSDKIIVLPTANMNNEVLKEK